MINKPAKPIPLFDCKTTQEVIGQQKFLDAFKAILDHGGYCQGPELYLYQEVPYIPGPKLGLILCSKVSYSAYKSKKLSTQR